MSALAQRVIDWQLRHGRHGLPWQGTRDPYRVWLSEVMLQQTQVSTVLGYYARFVQRFPDVQALAAAAPEDVLALWSGLGYYSRARNLHRCAREVVERYGGRFPADSMTLQQLPGIGRSTAAAIAAFCFGERAAILDGNVKRVLARALGFEGDLGERRHELALWAQAQALLPERGIEAYTQGLMDLGAQVCTRSRPRCGECPLQRGCVALGQGRPETYPVRTRRTRRGQRRSVLLWLTQGEAIWLEQRPERGVWAGLWSLPERGCGGRSDERSHAQRGDRPDEGPVEWPDEWPAKSPGHSPGHSPGESPIEWPGEGAWIEPFVHVLTHLDWELRPLRWRLPEALPAAACEGVTQGLGAGRWWSLEAALALGLPAPVRRLIRPE